MFLPRRAVLAGGAALAAPRLASAQAPRLLRFVPQSDLGVLDPIWSAAYVTRNHALMVFDTLYGMDAGYRIQPQMTEGHSVSDDGLAWTIRLREGLRFHDGVPVLARDAVASIRRWGARDGLGQSLLAATEALEAVEQGDCSVFHTYWSGLDMLDPAIHQYLRANGRAARSGWPSSTALEGMRETWLAAEADADRLRIAVAMQRQAFEDLPYVPVGQILPRFAHRREVTDVLGGFAIFWNLRKTRSELGLV